ncbi:hypothetical protein CAL7716_057550 [Calothrix sp. PCC 7716]|nr:hypothetical protein CAL7716_057550 [Calothrix sp. PCC 7716]
MGKFKDYTGQKFGHLECISISTLKRVHGATYWKCKCDCGQIIETQIGNVVNGITKSCGCLKLAFKDYTGQKFGRLECISLSTPARINGKTFWKCKCDCGKVINASTASIISGQKKSCGCLRHSESYFKDYTGQKFGRLECISRSTPARINGQTFWKCKCDCGKIVDVNIRQVVSGHTKSCGCATYTRKDYTGQKFGRLECIARSEKANVKSVKFWKFKCDCGKIIDVNIADVVSRGKKSCGCLKRSCNLIST